MVHILYNGKAASAQHHLADIHGAQDFEQIQDQGMSRKEVYTLLRETYANNALRDFPKSKPHPILEGMANMARKLFHATVPEQEDMIEIKVVTNEVLPIPHFIKNLTR